jgi:hypothetical protein
MPRRRDQDPQFSVPGFQIQLKDCFVWRRGKPEALMHHSDRGSQGGFNRSSQHGLILFEGIGRVAQPASSNQAFCAASYSAHERRHPAPCVLAEIGALGSKPLVFSLEPRCQGLCGSQK